MRSVGLIRGKLPKIGWEQAKVVKTAQKPSKKNGGKTVVRRSKKAGDGFELDVVERARKSGKPILFYVHGNCVGRADTACKTMVNLVLRQKSVVDMAKRFHAVEIDASKIPASLAKRYKLRVSPSVVFVDYRGKVLKTLAGRQRASHLTTTMKAVATQNDRTRKRLTKKAS